MEKAPPQAAHKTAPKTAPAQITAHAPKAVIHAAAAVAVRAKVSAGSVSLQSSLRVSSPRDPAEKEAEATAKKIMRMPTPDAATPANGNGMSGLQSPHVARFAGSIGLMQERTQGPQIARQGAGQARVGSSVASDIAAASGGGTPLPAGIRSFMEPRFRASFANIRIHTGDKSARLNRQVSAQAFTVGNQIFFGKDRFQPDTQEGKELIAHELTHTIQQGAAQQSATSQSATNQGQVQRKEEEASVHERSAPHVQRLGISDVLNFFANAANAIPGYRMFTILIGVNPINMSAVDRSAANILRAIVEFLPGGFLITQALDLYGVFEKAGAFVEQQLRTLGISGSSIRDALNRFLDSLGLRDIFNLGGVWDRAKSIFTEPISRIIQFAKGLFVTIMKFIRDAILKPIAGLASRTRGWDLLCAVLGQNPITGEAVPRTAETLIGGFMKLIGQEEIWENIKRGNAIARAWAWFQGALNGLMGFVRQIPGLFLQALQTLEIADVVLLPRAFAKVAGVFGDFIGNFLSWAGNTVWDLLEIIFSVVAPSVMVYLKRAAAAFRTILKDPIGFVGNLVRAGMLGFRQFAANFLKHLRTSLIGWLTGAMSGAGIYIPQAFNLREIIKFVLSVLGLTWQNIRQKLVRAVGETAVRALETGFDIVMTLVTQGPAAAWEKIQESLSNLREMVMEQIMTFVRDRIVTAAVTRLVSMLSPAGAFIQAIIAIYNTVMFFIERLRQIAQVAASFIDSISAIANGVIAEAANRVEQTMGGLLTLVISFLARIAGLGKVSDAVTNVVNRVRAPIDRALDRVVDWIVAQARRLGRFIAQAGVPQDPAQRLRLGMQAAVGAVNRFAGRRVGAAVLSPLLAAIRVRYGFQTLTVAPAPNGRWAVTGQVNPISTEGTNTLSDTAPAAPAAEGALGYRIQGVGTVIEAAVARATGGSLTPAPAQKLRRAYVGNTPTTLRGSAPSVIARQYGTAFATPEDARQRFSLVVGVNAIDDLAGRNRELVRTLVQSGANAAYPWATIGFLWKPAWVDRTGAPVADVSVVRQALNGPQVTAQDREAARRAEEASVTPAQIPYGAIRTLILQSGETSGFVGVLRGRANDVFVHVSDPDTVSFNPEGEAGGTPEALFQRFDRILDAIVANVQQHSGRGPQASDGGPPIVATGGYEFQFQLGPGERPGQTQDLRVQLSARLDMAVRRAMAAVDPQSVYFPEPNLLVQVTPETITASFGRGRLESRRLIDSLRQRGIRPRLIFDPSAALATSAERFGLERGTVVTTWGQLRDMKEIDVRAMVMSAQSHANQHNWSRQVAAAYGLAPGALGPVNDLWAVFFPVSDRLCGFNPTQLKPGVSGRQFTSLPAYGNISEIRPRLLEALRSPRRTAEENVALADRLIALARAGGLGLSDALDAMFRRMGG